VTISPLRAGPAPEKTVGAIILMNSQAAEIVS
jgi:hypothetical protein